MKKPVAFFSLMILALTGCPLRAEEPHLELVRGLRSRDLPDLALQYLEKLSQNPPPGLAPLLPLEMARTRLELARLENDAGRRSALYNQARTEFEAFLRNSPNDPLTPRANLEIARVIALQGKAQLSKAKRQEGRDAKAAEAKKAQATFADAAARLKAAAGLIDKQLTKYQDAKTAEEQAARQDLAQAKLQADFELGVLLIDQGNSYIDDPAKRGETIKEAATKLRELASQDPKNPLCWLARAWVGRCSQENDDPAGAQKVFVAILKEEGEPVEGAKRLVRYFRMALIPTDPKFKTPQAQVAETIREGEDWLQRYRNYHNTPEGFGVRYELANAYLKQAQAFPRMGPKKDQVAAAALPAFKKAQALYKGLEETENDYTEKAHQNKLSIILALSAERFKGGDPSKLKDFEEAYLWAQYEDYLLGEDEKKETDWVRKLPPEPDARQREELAERRKKLADGRKEHLRNIIAALTRALELVDEKVPLADVTSARASLAWAYLTSGEYYRAAVAGEYVARSEPQSGRAAVAAAYALQAYAQIVAEDERRSVPDGELASDRDRLRRLAEYMEQTWRDDPATDVARHQVGAMLLKDKKYRQAIEVLQRVSPAYPSFANARYQLASAAFELQKDDKLKEAERKALEQQAVAALRSIPEAPDAADPEAAQVYVLARLQLGGILYKEKKYTELRALGEALVKQLPGLPINPEAKAKLEPLVAELALLAVFGEANDTFNTGAYDKVLAMTDPAVKQVEEQAKSGKADVTNPQLTRGLIGLALRANVQLGNTDRAKHLLEVLQKTAGDVEGGSTAILVALVGQLKQQVEDLREKGKPAEAQLNKTVASFSAFLDTLAQQPNLKPEVMFFLANSYASLERHGKAAEQLRKALEGMPEPKPLDVKPPPPLSEEDEKDDKKVQEHQKKVEEYQKKQQDYQKKINLNHYTRITLARELREAKQFDDAKKELDAILKSDWGQRNIEVQKERIFLLQDQGKYAGRDGAALAWSGMMKQLRPRIEKDSAIKSQYYDCYYWYTYTVIKHAMKQTDDKKQNEYARTAANLIVKLEAAQADMGGEGLKKRYDALLKSEPLLKKYYDELKGGRAQNARPAQ
jgi:hypothetical protein